MTDQQLERRRVHHLENPNIYAEVIADSLSPEGARVTTIQACFHRFVLAEFNTHRRFSRNSASSRAIPVRKQLEQVMTNPAIPLVFPAEQRGMQGGEPLSEMDRGEAEKMWLEARDAAVEAAQALVGLRVHKSVVNRLLEPFMWHTVIVSSTEWDNFWNQRVSLLAQPEIHAVAGAMMQAFSESTPVKLEADEWHRPYIRHEDEEQVGLGIHPSTDANAIPALNAVSAARCARVSYLTQEGIRDMQQDLDLYERLTKAEPPHWSPLEHVARPTPWKGHPAQGNFEGWVQLRGLVEQERAAA